MTRDAIRFTRWLLTIAMTLALPRMAGANCGAEGCPLAAHGPETTVGRLSFNVGYQYIEQDRYWSGDHEISAGSAIADGGGVGHVVEQLTLTRSMLFNASARLSPRLLLTASLPYIDRIHRHALEQSPGVFIPNEWHMKGLGDATLSAFWTALAARLPASAALTVTLGFKLPTGLTNVAEVNGQAPEAPARPGTGSTDALAGIQWDRPIAMKTLDGLRATMPLSVSVSARYNGRGTDGYRVGNSLIANLGGGYALLRRVQLLAQLNASAHEPDDVGATDAEPQITGGTAVLVSPGLRLDILPGMSMFGYYQIRLYQYTNGPQLVAPYHVSVGLGYALGR